VDGREVAILEEELSRRLEVELARLPVRPLEVYLSPAPRKGAMKRVFDIAAMSGLTVVLIVAALGAGQLLRAAREQPAGASGQPSSELRHKSGVVLLGPADQTAVKPLPEPLAKALSDAQELARDNPDLFGYPYADRSTGELVLSPVNAEGQSLAHRWTPRGAEAIAVTRRTRLVDRSYAQLEAIRHEAIGPGVAGLPDGDAIQATSQDDEHNRVLIIITRMSDPLLFALAARYGTEAIEVRLDPSFGPFQSLSQEESVRDELLIGASAVFFLVATFALVATLLMRRRARE
jgi:hypothetical protein